MFSILDSANGILLKSVIVSPIVKVLIFVPFNELIPISVSWPNTNSVNDSKL